MRHDKRHMEIANKYCHKVMFYRDLNDPYSIEEIDADRNQAAEKRKLILAYLENLSSASYRFSDLYDQQKRKLVAVELAGARNVLTHLWSVTFPGTSAFNTIFVDLDKAGADLFPSEYKKIFPNSI